MLKVSQGGHDYSKYAARKISLSNRCISIPYKNPHTNMQMSLYDRKIALSRAALVAEYDATYYSMVEFLSLYERKEILTHIYAVLGPVDKKKFQHWYLKYRDLGSQELTATSYVNLRCPASLVHRATNFEKNSMKIYPLQQIKIDHVLHDLLVYENGQIFRPWTTLCFDSATGKILSFFAGSSSDSYSILTVLYLAIKKYGIPQSIKIVCTDTHDLLSINQLDDHSSTTRLNDEQKTILCGIFLSMGIPVEYALPFGQEKHEDIENFFNILHKKFDCQFPSLRFKRGKSSKIKTKGYHCSNHQYSQNHSLLHLSRFTKKLSAWLDNYVEHINLPQNHSSINSHFYEYFRKKYFDTRIFIMTLSVPKIVKVHANGVTSCEVNYYSPLLHNYHGKKVILLPIFSQNITHVLVCDLSGRYLCEAQINSFFQKSDLFKNHFFSLKRTQGYRK